MLRSNPWLLAWYWLFISFAAWTVAGATNATNTTVQEGPFSINPVYPSLCTASTITYSSSMVRPTGAFVIDGSFGKPGSVWNITLSDGIRLWSLASGEFGKIGQYVTRNSDGTYTFKAPTGFKSEPMTGQAQCQDRNPPSNSTTSLKPTGMVPVSWSAGACTLTSYTDSTVTCGGTPTPPLVPVRGACSCPGGLYETLNGNGGPCSAYVASQGDLMLPTNACPSTKPASPATMSFTNATATSISRSTMGTGSYCTSTASLTLSSFSRISTQVSSDLLLQTSLLSSSSSTVSTPTGGSTSSTLTNCSSLHTKASSGVTPRASASTLTFALSSSALSSSPQYTFSQPPHARNITVFSTLVLTKTCHESPCPGASSVTTFISSLTAWPTTLTVISTALAVTSEHPSASSTSESSSCSDDTLITAPPSLAAFSASSSEKTSTDACLNATLTSSGLSSKASRYVTIETGFWTNAYKAKRQATGVSSASLTATGPAQYDGVETSPSGTACAAVTQFTLTVVGIIACDKPIADTCSTTHNVDLTPQQWQAYSTNDFLEAYVKNNSAKHGGKNINFMSDMIKEYIEVGSSINCNGDVSDETGTCNFEDPCDTVKTPGPYKYQAIFVIQSMINYSRSVVQIIISLLTAQSELLVLGGLVSKFVSAFEPNPGAQSTHWEHVLAIVSTLVTFIAAFFIFFSSLVPWFAFIVGPLILASASFGTAENIGTAQAKAAIDDFTINNLNKNGQAVEEFIGNQSTMVTSLQQAYWKDAGVGNQSVTDLLRDGAWVQSTPVFDNTTVAGSSNRNLSDYFETVMLLSLTNTWLKQADVYIIFIPYGMVWTQDWKYAMFTKEDCRKNYFAPGGNKFTQKVVGSCTAGTDPSYGEGMSIYFNAGGLEKPGWFSRDFVYPFGNQKYDPMSAMSSSVSAFLQHGFNYNITSSLAAGILNDRYKDEASLRNALSYTPETTGTFNVPVCKIPDLTAVPQAYFAKGLSGKGQVNQQNYPCTCMSDRANYTSPTGQVTFFRDVASKKIVDELNQQQKLGTQHGAPTNWCPGYAN